MIQTRFLIFLIFLSFSGCTAQQNDSTKELTLKEINPSVLIGSPIEISFDNAKYREIITTEFNTGQALWFARWRGWPYPGFYNFTDVNSNINWMKEKGLKPTVHMLVGPDTYMPDWLIKGTWKKSELDSLLRDMIYHIMDSNDNKNKVDSWNVINELFEEDGSYRTNMVWNQLGWEEDASALVGGEKINQKHPVFISKTLTYCREKTKHKLELRDFNIESNDTDTKVYKKHRAIYQLVKHLQNKKVPLDALGIQGHLIVGDTNWRVENDELKKAVSHFKSLGVEVYITELDASLEAQKWDEVIARKQKNDYYDYIKQAVQGGASRVYFWGIQDGMDKGWLTHQYPLLWDENLNKKPAYYGVLKALLDTKW